MSEPKPGYLAPRTEESYLTEHLITLQKIAGEANPEPKSEGERIAWGIYVGALSDAIKTLKSIIDYREK